jgi:hypothetical protein
MTFWEKAKQNKPTKSALPVFSTDTAKEARGMLILLGRRVFFPTGSNAGEKWGYVFNDFDPHHDDDDLELTKMKAEMDRVTEKFRHYYSKIYKKGGNE